MLDLNIKMGCFINQLKLNGMTDIIKCNKCGYEYDYSIHTICPHCGEYQNVEDEDFDNGIMYPGHETWND